jgi:hypothetical protein
VGRKNVQFIRITSSAGGTPTVLQSPLQSSAYRNITLVALDNSIVVSGTRKVGRKTRTVTITL